MILTAVFALFNACGTLSQMAALLTCNYSVRNVDSPKLAGINIANMNDITNLDAVTALRVSATILSGALPLSATINVGVSNPNSVAAQIAGLEWILSFEGVDLLSGTTLQQVSVAPNGGSSVIPFTVQTDLVSLFNKDSRDRMLKFTQGLLHIGDKNGQVTLKIRPSISFGGQVFRMGYITVSKEI